MALLAVCGTAAAAAGGPDPLLAPSSRCPGQSELRAPIGDQQRAMHCLTDFARARAGLPPLSDDRALDRSAGLKSRDILRCDQFDHRACGRDFTYWIERSGYLTGSCWRAGENIAYGTGSAGAPRSIFVAWLGSPGHRHNILGPYRDLGVGLRIGSLGDVHGAHIWTQHFGAHC